MTAVFTRLSIVIIYPSPCWNAPSGNVYYNGNGERVENLGVHEHWNNSTEKQYSRNLGKEEGIELVRVFEK